MSGVRGRVIKYGGMARDPQGAGQRTAGPPEAPITRPAYQVSPGGQTQVQGVASRGGPGTPLLDLSSVSGWRIVWALVAAAYLGFWFVSLSRGGLSAGVRV